MEISNTPPPLDNQDSIKKPRTRAFLHSYIHSQSDEYQTPPLLPSSSSSSTVQSPRSNQSRKRPRHGQDQDEYKPSTAPIGSVFNKTWNLYKTTPFFNYDQSQCSTYEQELLTFIAANAANFSSSTLASKAGGASFLNGGDRAFPVQIDSAGHDIIETLENPGDIKSIEIQLLNPAGEDAKEPIIVDVVNENAADDNQRGTAGQIPNQTAQKDSLLITLTVKPKGKVKDQQYYCAIILDKLQDVKSQRSSDFTHFSLVFLKTPVVFGQLILQWLERKFDCRICRLLFQTFELRKVVDSSLEDMYREAQGRQADRKSRSIELTYALPQAVEGLRTITVSVQPDEARQLLTSRVDESRAGFLDGLEAHCSQSLKIDFGRLELTRAGCTAWYIASEGKAKIFDTIEDRYSLSELLKNIGRCGT
ncbi:hypothetical protein BGZ83_003031 [Gryganskiella cystojenkinii]|nr:hypothetical protein BGZ83_003031 [Gryganskiella cystojenkinii]